MKILVINSGSSSLKYKVFDMTDESVLASGLVEKIGIAGDSQLVTYQPTGRDKIRGEESLPTHRDALRHVLNQLSDPEVGGGGLLVRDPSSWPSGSPRQGAFYGIDPDN